MLRIREARQKAGLNQKQFMELLQQHDRLLDWPTVSKYENGRHYPTPQQTLIICKVACVTLGELASPDDVRFCAQVVKSAARRKKAYRRTKAARIAFRVLESEKPQFDKALRICGYPTIQTWGDEVKSDLLDRAAKKQAAPEFPPEGTALSIDMNDPEYNPYLNMEDME